MKIRILSLVFIILNLSKCIPLYSGLYSNVSNEKSSRTDIIPLLGFVGGFSQSVNEVGVTEAGVSEGGSQNIIFRKLIGGDNLFIFLHNINLMPTGESILHGAVRGNGNLFGLASQTLNEYFIAKLDQNAGLLWADRQGFSFETNNLNVKPSMCVDSLGNIFILNTVLDNFSGSFYPKSTQVLIKYNNLGNKLWSETLTSDIASASSNAVYSWTVKADSYGNVYTLGYSYGGIIQGESLSSPGGYVAKYSSVSGNLIWSKLLVDTTGNSQAPFKDIGFSADGNFIYVLGNHDQSIEGQTKNGNYDLFLMKLNANGDKLWTRMIGGGSPNPGYFVGESILSDSNENWIIFGFGSGNFDGDVANTQQGNNNIVMAKFDPNGNKIYSKVINFNNQSIDQVTVVKKGTDRFLITGVIYIQNTLSDFEFLEKDQTLILNNYYTFLLEIDTNGNPLRRRILSRISNNFSPITSISTNQIGNIIISSYPISGNNVFFNFPKNGEISLIT